jgi:hypothetical protein
MMTMFMFAALFLSSQAQAGPWTVAAKTDPMTDRTVTAAHTASADGVGLLGFRCDQGQFSALVLIHRSVIHVNDPFQVLVRIDGGEAKPYKAYESVDHNAAFIDLNQYLSAAVARARESILVRMPSVWTVADGSTRDRDLAFPVDGAAQAIDQVRQACGLPTLYETLVQPVPQVRPPE